MGAQDPAGQAARQSQAGGEAPPRSEGGGLTAPPLTACCKSTIVSYRTKLGNEMKTKTFKLNYELPGGETRYQFIASHSAESARSVWTYTVADCYKVISIEEIS